MVVVSAVLGGVASQSLYNRNIHRKSYACQWPYCGFKSVIGLINWLFGKIFIGSKAIIA